MKQRLTVMAALFLLSAAFCQAQTVLGTIAFQNDKWASYAQVDGKYLYVLLKFGTWEKVRNEIAVWDMSNPGVPVQAGIIPLDFHAYRFLKSGDNLFVISYPSRSETTTIRAINVSNPTRPVVRGTIVVDEELYELRPKVGTADRFLCRYYDAAIQADKARELDISNPAAMRVSLAGMDIRLFNRQQAGDLVFESENRGSDYQNPDVVFSVLDPAGRSISASPVKLAGVQAGFDYYLKSGNTLYGVSGGDDGLARITSINIADPKKPVLMKYINLYETFTDVRWWAVQNSAEFLYFAGIAGKDGKPILRLMKAKADSLSPVTTAGKIEVPVSSDSRVWLLAAAKCLVAVHSDGVVLFSY